jgi:isoleucyl-tRNA synthetase
MKYPTFTPLEFEENILTFWKQEKIIENLRERNQNGEKFYFLEGPPYTSGKIHLGHAWNMALKDMVLRYKRMHGRNVWDRMGYDMHGLPTEQKVMKKFELKNKEDIQNFGVEKFVRECEKFCTEMMHGMNEDFKRIGATLDFTDPYQPISSSFMDAQWWLIKKAHEKGRLYQGLRTMHWDAATGTATAKHELEYKQVTDTAIFVKFKREAQPNSYFIIWTTTPWTIPLNLAIMVNPELEYVEVEVALDEGNENWVVAHELLESVMQKAKIEKHTVLKTFKGSELTGDKYEHPLGVFDLLPEELQENPKLFTVLLSKEYVDASAGTGLVHSAPGCGPEDYEVGHENGIPPFNCVNEEGFFEKFGDMSGMRAKKDDSKFIDLIDAKGALLAKEKYVHDYPYGERSKEPVIFRTTKQWFFKVEDLKEQLLSENEDVYWYPEMGKNAFRSWIDNLRDNSITKQRYWGTAVPIWMCKETGDYIVVGSKQELEELSGKTVENMHIPWIDEITIEQNGKIFKRVPDVLDVWIDAGTTSWNCLDYPNRTDLFEKFFPADFILEGKDQIRGWFNLLMIASTLGFGKPSFKNVYMHGFVTDVGGVKMSKSIGNIISPYEVINKFGADTLRYYMNSATAGEDIGFSWDELKVKSRYLNIVWNMHKLLLNLAQENEINPFKISLNDVTPDIGLEERYILSRLHSTIKETTGLFETYKLDLIIPVLDTLFLDLSRTYIQLVREKSSQCSIDEKKVCMYTIGQVFFETLKMFQTIAPFASEAMYLNLKEEFDLSEKSISYYSWPVCNEALINTKLELQFKIFEDVLGAALHTREKAQRGVRWPVEKIVIVTQNKDVQNAVNDLSNLICAQINAKHVVVQEEMQGTQVSLKVDYKKIGPIYGPLTQKIITHVAGLDAQIIVSAFDKDKEFEFTVEGSDITLLPEHVEVIRSSPVGYESATGKNFDVYLSTAVTDLLEAEGFAREIMRKVQTLRKDAGLEKKDRVNLTIQTSEKLQKYLVEHKSSIMDKVGATTCEIVTEKPQKELAHSLVCKVKAEEFMVGFDLV